MSTATATRSTARKVQPITRVRPVGDGVRMLDADQQLAVINAVESLRDRTIEPGEVMLYDPLYPQYDFGPYGVHEGRDDPKDRHAGNIHFGEAEPHLWLGPDDHPLLEQLRNARPDIIEMRAVEESVVYACPECEAKFDDKTLVQRHYKAAHIED